MGQCYNHLSAMEREEISRSLALNHGCLEIARHIWTQCLERRAARFAEIGYGQSNIGPLLHHIARNAHCLSAGRQSKCRPHETRQPCQYVPTHLPRDDLRGTGRRGQIPSHAPISLRPLEVNVRRVPDHWEGTCSRCKPFARRWAPWSCALPDCC